jgi:peptidoglycan/LPS O-acetylase OafA/YrhL
LKSSHSNYIPTLDGWRAFAILLVLFEHGSFFTFRRFGWTSLGGHGVEIFFVISGYLITGKLLEDGSLPNFYLRRVFRILPVLLAYVGMIAVLGFSLRLIPLSWTEVTASLLFVRNYCDFPYMNQTGAGWFTGHLWSLSIEEQFYLIWPLVLLKVGKGTVRRQLLAALLLFSFGCSILAFVRVGRALELGGWHWLPNVKFGGLVVGCVLRIAFSDARMAVALGKVFSGRSLAAVAIALGYFAIFHSRVTVFDPIICGMALCATLVEPTSLVGKLLELSALRWIGRLSYSLYIWQQLFTGFGLIYLPFGIVNRFPVNLPFLLAASCASYYLMERPLMRLGHRLAKPPTNVEPTPLIAAQSRIA